MCIRDRETLRQDDLERLFADVVKRPRITEFDDFGGRIPSTRPPIKTPGELAKERGEPWPPPVTDPFAMPVLPTGRDAGDRASDGDSRAHDRPGDERNGVGASAGVPRGPAGSADRGQGSSGIPAYGTVSYTHLTLPTIYSV